MRSRHYFELIQVKYIQIIIIPAKIKVKYTINLYTERDINKPKYQQNKTFKIISLYNNFSEYSKLH